MKKVRDIVHELNFGQINCKLDEIMKKENVSTYELSSKANIRFQTIQTLRENKATRIDFGVLAKLCYALDIKIEDVIEYVEAKEDK